MIVITQFVLGFSTITIGLLFLVAAGVPVLTAIEKAGTKYTWTEAFWRVHKEWRESPIFMTMISAIAGFFTIAFAFFVVDVSIHVGAALL